VFHLYVGALGPANIDLLRSIVQAHEWVTFPAGAGSKVTGSLDGDEFVLNGAAMFGSGAKYGDWAGVAFMAVDPPDAAPSTDGKDMRADERSPTRPDLRFTVVRLDDPGVRVEETWDGMALRASSTDTVHYRDVRVPASRCCTWFSANRAEVFRHADYPVIHPRYREDWVGVSDLWLAAQACGIVGAALDEAVAGVRHRKAIIGAAMVEMPMVIVGLGRVWSLLAAARATVAEGCRQVDARIATGDAPKGTTRDDGYERQMALSVSALEQCADAMQLLTRVLGGNGLRESGSFERRLRDMQALPIHINAHPDRVHERVGRMLLGLHQKTF
jgi:alkylation response protein AidB-like acyl-CoA dehydrogenase